MVSNLARPGGETTNTHIATAAGWLSGAIAKPTEGEDIYLGTTADQIIAKKIGQDTPFPSIELAVENFSGLHRRLRHQLQLRLREHAGLVDPDDAAADRDQPARGVRAPVRPAGHQANSVRPGCARTAASSTRSAQDANELTARAGRARQRPPQGLSRQHPRDRAPDPAHRGEEQHAGDAARRAARRARVLRGARRPALRHRRRGLSGGPHPRVHADDGPRGRQQDLSGAGDHRGSPPAVAPRRQAGADCQARPAEPLPHRAVRQVHRQAEGRRPTATAACSTTRSSPTAAA